MDKPQVEHLDLETFGGERSRFTLLHSVPSLPLCHLLTWPDMFKPRTQNLPFSASIPVLQQVRLPEGNFKYTPETHEPAAQAGECDFPGRVKSMILPTGGKIAWTYGLWNLLGPRLEGFGSGVIARKT